MMNKIQLFNAKSAGLPMEHGTTFNCVAVGTYPDTDKDGNPVMASAFAADTGEVYTAIGAGIANSIEMLDDILQDMPQGVQIEVVVSKTNSGRDFKQIRIVE